MFDDQQLVGQQFAEAAVDFEDGLCGGCASGQSAVINPLLHRDGETEAALWFDGR